MKTARSVVRFGLGGTWLALALFFKSCGGAPSVVDPSLGDGASDLASVMNPHVLPERGPWFEGWYARFQPSERGAPTLGLIVASLLPPGVSSRGSAEDGLPGFISLLKSGGDNPLQVLNERVEKSFLKVDGSFVRRDPLPSPTADFSWEAPGHGHLSQDRVDLRAGDGWRLQAQMETVSSWGLFELFGPEGPAVLVRALPLHWYIYTPSTKATWSLSKNGVETRYAGHVHFEKNWGRSFPKSYIWLQGLSLDGQSSVVAAGGDALSFGPANLEAFLVQIRTPERTWLFSPAAGGVWTRRDVDACAGRLRLEMRSPTASLELLASASRQTFGDLLIPTGESLEAHSEQSFESLITARITTTGGRRHEISWTGAALEFGGDNKCSDAQ